MVSLLNFIPGRIRSASYSNNFIVTLPPKIIYSTALSLAYSIPWNNSMRREYQASGSTSVTSRENGGVHDTVTELDLLLTLISTTFDTGPEQMYKLSIMPACPPINFA